MTRINHKWHKYLKGVIYLVCAYLCAGDVHSLTELSGSYGYKRVVYGQNRENTFITQSYSGSIALYLYNLTGIEINGSQSVDLMTENHEIEIQDNVSIFKIQQKVYTNIYGIGLRQALAHQTSPIIPVISLGYAKQVKSGHTDYYFDVYGEKIKREYQMKKSQYDSVFASFILKIQISRMFSINGSVKSIFRATEFKEAKDHLYYEAGFSCLF